MKTVEFKGVTDVAGQIGMSFSLDNKSADEIWVLTMNASINGVMAQFVSGAPAQMQGGKSLNQVWIANPDTIGVSDSSEATNIEFSLNFADTDSEMIHIDL